MSEAHKLPVDSFFFHHIDSEEKAYWLGFMYADGYVTGSVMGVKLHIKDIDHLQKFREDIQSQHTIGTYVMKSGFANANGTPYCSLTIKDKQLVQDLNDCGVTYNKSKTLVFPTEDVVPSHLIHHFIRGYFDGDGSVYASSATPSISFEGTKEFLERL